MTTYEKVALRQAQGDEIEGFSKRHPEFNEGSRDFAKVLQQVGDKLGHSTCGLLSLRAQ